MAKQPKSYGFQVLADVTAEQIIAAADRTPMHCLKGEEATRVRAYIRKTVQEICPREGLVHPQIIERLFNVLNDLTCGLKTQKLADVRRELQDAFTEVKTVQTPKRRKKKEGPKTVGLNEFTIVRQSPLTTLDMAVEMDALRENIADSVDFVDAMAFVLTMTSGGPMNVEQSRNQARERIMTQKQPSVAIYQIAQRYEREKIEDDPRFADLVRFVSTPTPLDNWKDYRANNERDGVPIDDVRVTWTKQWETATKPQPAITGWITEEIGKIRTAASNDVIRKLGSPSQMAHLTVGVGILYHTRLSELMRSAGMFGATERLPPELQSNVNELLRSGLMHFLLSLHGLPHFRAVENGSAFSNFFRSRKSLAIEGPDTNDPIIKRVKIMDTVLDTLQDNLQIELVPALAAKYNWADLARASALCNNVFSQRIALEEGVGIAGHPRPLFPIGYCRPVNRERVSDGVLRMTDDTYICEQNMLIGDDTGTHYFSANIVKRGEHVCSEQKHGVSTLSCPEPTHIPQYVQAVPAIRRAMAVIGRHIDRLQEKFPELFAARCYDSMTFIEHGDSIFLLLEPESIDNVLAAFPRMERVDDALRTTVLDQYHGKNNTGSLFRLCALADVAPTTSLKECALDGVVLPISPGRKEGLKKGDGSGFEKTLRNRRQIIREVIYELGLENDADIAYGTVDKTMLRFAGVTAPDSKDHDGYLGYKVFTFRSLALQILACDVESEGTFLVFGSKRDPNEFTHVKNEKPKLRKDLGAVTAPHFHTSEQWREAMTDVVEQAMDGKPLRSMAFTNREKVPDCPNPYNLTSDDIAAVADDLVDIAEIINGRMKIPADGPHEVKPWQLTLAHMQSIHPGDVYLRYRGDQGSESGNSYLFNMAVYLGLAPSVVQAMKLKGGTRKTLGVLKELAFPGHAQPNEESISTNS